MTTMRHFCIDIRGFIKNNRFPKGYRGVFQHDDGTPMDPNEAREFLFDELAKGRKVIPCGPCDNFSYETGCGGHPVQDETEDIR